MSGLRVLGLGFKLCLPIAGLCGVLLALKRLTKIGDPEPDLSNCHINTHFSLIDDSWTLVFIAFHAGLLSMFEPSCGVKGLEF